MASMAVTIPDRHERRSESPQEEDLTEAGILKSYEDEQLRKIFVGNLSYTTTTDMLKDYFGKFGELEEANVPLDNHTKQSKGFGFVIYHESNMLDAVMKMRPHKLDGRVLEPRRAIRREEANNPAANASTNKMYIGPLSNRVDEHYLKEYFSKHGNVVNVDKGQGKDHAFLTFDDFDPVDKCVNMKRHILGGQISVAKKGLTKTAMAEAEARWHAKKKRQEEREYRDKKDYSQEVKRAAYDERRPHRQYPSEWSKDSAYSGSRSSDRDRDRRDDRRRDDRRRDDRRDVRREDRAPAPPADYYGGYPPYGAYPPPPYGYPAYPGYPPAPYGYPGGYPDPNAAYGERRRDDDRSRSGYNKREY